VAVTVKKRRPKPMTAQRLVEIWLDFMSDTGGEHAARVVMTDRRFDEIQALFPDRPGLPHLFGARVTRIAEGTEPGVWFLRNG
jgi:hypothetical protein